MAFGCFQVLKHRDSDGDSIGGENMKKILPCKKTVSGNHIWVMVDIGEAKLKTCAACGLVDDRAIDKDDN